MSTQIQNFYKTTITRNWTASTGDFNVSVAPTISAGWLVVSPNNATLREIVKYTATGTNAYGPYITVSERGIGGTSAQVHTIGETVRMNITAEHWTEMQDDIDSIVAAGLPAGSEGDIMIYTGGAWTASDTLPEDKILTATVSLSSADILALHTTPKQLLPAPGAGKINIVQEVIYSFTAGGTQYVNGNVLRTRYNGTTIDLTNWITTASTTSATDTITKTLEVVNSDENTNYALVTGINKAVELTTGTAFITGTGTAKIFIKYRILTL